MTLPPLAPPFPNERNSPLRDVVELSTPNDDERVATIAEVTQFDNQIVEANDSDSDEPVSPVIADTLSPKRRRRASLKRVRGGSASANGITENNTTEEEVDSDADGDGYARGIMPPEDDAAHADESDDLFLTPRRPTRADCTTPASNGGMAEYATFDPILSLLDDHWAVLGLGQVHDENDAAGEEETLPDYLAPLNENLLLSSTGNTRVRDADRELMEALRDADALDASCARYSIECNTLRKEAATRERKAIRLERENQVAAREIRTLTEAMATLQAANDVDRRINDLLIADQAEEIRALRSKLVGHKPACKRSASATSSVSGEPSDAEHDGDTEPVPTRIRRPVSMVTGRAKERAQLMERKQSLFKEYEKRHSMTIQHVVRRSSQMLLKPNNHENTAATSEYFPY